METPRAPRARKLALKVDVDTYRGTRLGVPRLVELLERARARATFLFSLGPDHTGRAIKRAFRPGFLGKVARTSVVSHYGVRTLLYGTLLPGPDIGRRCAEVLRSVRTRGFEVGIHCWDHVRWQDGVERARNDWTERELDAARNRFHEVFGEDARVHGAAGWQMNRHAFRLMQRLGFDYSSDTRGTHPFMPVYDGEPIACPQVPTTLPTLDELIGMDGMDGSNVHEHLLSLTADGAAPEQVYTLHAELEGMRFADAFAALLDGWRAQGYELVAMRELVNDINLLQLPRHRIERGVVPGRSGTLMIQGRLFPSEPAGETPTFAAGGRPATRA